MGAILQLFAWNQNQYYTISVISSLWQILSEDKWYNSVLRMEITKWNSCTESFYVTHVTYLELCWFHVTFANSKGISTVWKNETKTLTKKFRLNQLFSNFFGNVKPLLSRNFCQWQSDFSIPWQKIECALISIEKYFVKS